MFLQIAISAVLLSSIIGMTVWFFNAKNGMGKDHNQTMDALERAISNNRNQINFRSKHLNKYDLLQYNLHDALIVQHEIEV